MRRRRSAFRFSLTQEVKEYRCYRIKTASRRDRRKAVFLFGLQAKKWGLACVRYWHKVDIDRATVTTYGHFMADRRCPGFRPHCR